MQGLIEYQIYLTIIIEGSVETGQSNILILMFKFLQITIASIWQMLTFWTLWD